MFIASLERSGSTVLDLTLGSCPGVVSLGEVARVIQPHGLGGVATCFDRPCSCGRQASDCDFWGVLLRRIDAQEEKLSLASRYAMVLERASEVFGPNTVIVDSSKFLRALAALRDIDQELCSLTVLVATRDVRGWMSSARRAARRKKEIPYSKLLSREIGSLWLAYLRFNVARMFPGWLPLEWLIRNWRIRCAVRRIGRPAIAMSYEALVLDTTTTIGDICMMAGLPRPNTEGVNPSRGHIVRGNRMAFSGARRPELQYDGAWQRDLLSQYEAMLWPFVMRQNVKWVYSGVTRMG